MHGSVNIARFLCKVEDSKEDERALKLVNCDPAIQFDTHLLTCQWVATTQKDGGELGIAFVR